MSRENVEQVRGTFEAFLRRELRSTHLDFPIGRYAQVWTFKDGLVVHWKLYESQSEALEAAGLPAAPR